MIYLLVALFLGLVPAAIAHSKGENFFLWWAYGAAFWIIAFPHSLLMKPNQAALETKALRAGHKKCPDCAELIREEAVICRHCGREFAEKLATATPPDLQPVANRDVGAVGGESLGDRPPSAAHSNVERIVLGGMTALLVVVISMGIFVTISSMNDDHTRMPVSASSSGPPKPLSPPRRMTDIGGRTSINNTAHTNATSGVSCREVSQHGFVRFLVCDPKAVASDWQRAGMDACKGRTVCNVWMWDRGENAGTSLPMTDSEANSVVAVWIGARAELKECRREGC
tara:strand:+ start:45 stop:896 length:852 start_codon:yes stop_codon:yes gene_type:complete